MKKLTLKKRRDPIGPGWLRCCLFAAAGLCMGLAVAGAMQWIFLGTLPAVLEWVLDYPAHLLMTALLWAVPVLVLGTLTGRLWIAALPVGAAGLILALVDYFKNAINGSPLELADFGLAEQAGNVAELAGDLTPPEDFYLAAAGLALCVLILFLTRRITALEGAGPGPGLPGLPGPGGDSAHRRGNPGHRRLAGGGLLHPAEARGKPQRLRPDPQPLAGRLPPAQNAAGGL